jgi:hypothetical protein
MYYHDIAREMEFRRSKNWSLENRAKIYIYDDVDHYQRDGKVAGWSSGHAYSKEKIIRTFPSAHGFFDTTLPHELGHIIFREFIGDDVLVPLWFEEGVAMRQEKARRWGAHQAVNEAIAEGTFIPLPVLNRMRLYRDTPVDVVSLYYAESASIVHFIIKDHGQSRFVRLCRELRDGKTFMEAFFRIYSRYKNWDDLNEAWVQFLKNV